MTELIVPVVPPLLVEPAPEVVDALVAVGPPVLPVPLVAGVVPVEDADDAEAVVELTVAVVEPLDELLPHWHAS